MSFPYQPKENLQPVHFSCLIFANYLALETLAAVLTRPIYNCLQTFFNAKHRYARETTSDETFADGLSVNQKIQCRLLIVFLCISESPTYYLFKNKLRAIQPQDFVQNFQVVMKL